MNQPKIRTKYLHISSKHRLQTAEDKTDVKVHLSQPINNVYRVAVKSFSMANAMYNIRSGEETLEWVEFYKPAGQTTYQHKVFSVTIPPGYYSATNLCSVINNLIVEQGSRLVTDDAGEQPLQVTFSQDPDEYFINISVSKGVGDEGDKWFSPYQSRHTIWRLLGFADTQVVNTLKRKSNVLDVVAEEILRYNIKVETGVEDERFSYYEYAKLQAGSSGTPTTLSSNLPTTIESPAGIYLTSDALTSGGTYETRTHPDSLHLDAMPQAILEFIQFDQNRYSWIHYNSALPHYHYLNDTSLHDIDIQVRSENGQILSHAEVGDYNLVLVFECLVEDEYSAEFIKAYNSYGYDIAHTPERIVGLKN